MKFTLDAGGAQTAGQGIGNLFKAYALGPQMRQQAEQEAAKSAADLYYRQMAGNKYGAEAEGLSMTNSARKAPVDPSLSRYMQDAYKLFQATGDTNAQNLAKAGTEVQTQGIRDQALANVGDLDMMNRLNALSKEGTTYKPFAAVGNTGGAINQATGQGIVSDAVLRELFGDKNASEIMENKAQANSANASAGKYTAEADIERQKADRLRTTGALPGTGAEGSEGALSSTILNTLRVPALDAKGRPVRNPITGELETVVDQDAQKSFYQWADQNKRKPTAAAFTQWEAQGRPGANKNPGSGQAQPTIVQAPPAQQRKPNMVYDTPKGPMKWTGTGWLPAN